MWTIRNVFGLSLTWAPALRHDSPMSRVPATIVPVSLPAPKSSLQYDLFTTFLGNAADLSNTIELWDCVPRYAYGARRQSDHRASGAQPQVYQHTFKWQPQPKAHNPPLTCDLTITPARVLTDAGWIDVFPSADEELVEEVLRKLFADQQYGLHDPQAGRSYVRFSLHTIRRELAARGKTRSIPQIKQALDILNKATVKVTAHDASGKARPLCQGPIIPHLFSRGEVANPDTTLWAAQLHPLITSAIEKLTYRQFNYKVLMSLASPLARWLLKRLSHDYLNASLVDPYHVLMSSIARDSGLLQHSRTSANIKTLEAALEELVTRGILLTYTAEKRCQGRAITDVKYALMPSSAFVVETKAANARENNSDARLSATSLPGPWHERHATRQRKLGPVRRHTGAAGR